MKAIYILCASFLLFLCNVSALITRYCNVANEPTFGEIFQLVSPVNVAAIDISSGGSSIDDVLLRAGGSTISRILNALYHAKFPLGYLISDGVYHIDMSKAESYRGYDVVLLQHKPLIQQALCSLSSATGVSRVSLVDGLCGCWWGVGLIDFAGDRASQFIDEMGNAHDWCVHLDNGGSILDGEARPSDTQRVVRVDPMVSACVVIISESSLSSTAQARYSLVMPTVGSAVARFSPPPAVLESLRAETAAVISPLIGHVQFLAAVSAARDLSEWINANIDILMRPLVAFPLYPAMWLLALTLLSIEHDFAASPVTKYLAAACLGVFFAVIWVAIALYRIWDYMMKSHVPVLGGWISGGMTAAVFGASMLLTMETAQRMIIDNIYLLWAHGAFGLTWLGKAYFVFSVAGALFVAWWWDLFSEKSTSRYMLRVFFRWVPVALLWHSTSCKDVATLMVLVALNSDALAQWLLTAWISAEASRQTPTYEYSGQALMDSDEFALQGQLHTQAALEDLRKYLSTAEGKAKMYQLSDRHRSERRHHVADMMSQFVRGTFGGLPGGLTHASSYDEESEDLSEGDENGRSRRTEKKSVWGQVKSLLTFVTLCTVLAVMVSVVLAVVY